MLHLGTVNPDAHRRLGQHATVHTRNSVLRPLIRATQQGTATSRKIEVRRTVSGVGSRGQAVLLPRTAGGAVPTGAAALRLGGVGIDLAFLIVALAVQVAANLLR